ncbi:hypothetical protein J6590_092399 [Homalodisca vitripennis]|nr:hypothetical protein J6590_092399 [Homalodisca vitripennis]
MTNLGRDWDCLCLKHNGSSETVLKTVAVHSSLLLEPTAMAAVKLLCAPRLEHSMVLGPVLGQFGLSVLSYLSHLGHSYQSVGESLRQTTDQLFTGTGYCSETRSAEAYCVSVCSLLFPFPHGWLTPLLSAGNCLSHPLNFILLAGFSLPPRHIFSVPVSAVSGTGAASLTTALKPKLNSRVLPALLYRHPTGVYVLLFISSGTRLDPKCFFTFLILNLRGLGCMERCQLLCLEEG